MPHILAVFMKPFFYDSGWLFNPFIVLSAATEIIKVLVMKIIIILKSKSATTKYY